MAIWSFQFAQCLLMHCRRISQLQRRPHQPRPPMAGPRSPVQRRRPWSALQSDQPALPLCSCRQCTVRLEHADSTSSSLDSCAPPHCGRGSWPALGSSPSDTQAAGRRVSPRCTCRWAWPSRRSTRAAWRRLAACWTMPCACRGAQTSAPTWSGAPPGPCSAACQVGAPVVSGVAADVPCCACRPSACAVARAACCFNQGSTKLALHEPVSAVLSLSACLGCRPA